MHNCLALANDFLAALGRLGSLTIALYGNLHVLVFVSVCVMVLQASSAVPGQFDLPRLCLAAAEPSIFPVKAPNMLT